MQDLLSVNSNISFAIPGDPSGDSCTHLNILLPDTEAAKRTVDEFNKAGVAGFDYWFLNMYHFINQWDHMKNLQTVSKLPVEVLGKSQDYNAMQLPKTQAIIGRLISFGVKVSWTEEQMRELASGILACVNKATQSVKA